MFYCLGGIDGIQYSIPFRGTPAFVLLEIVGEKPVYGLYCLVAVHLFYIATKLPLFL